MVAGLTDNVWTPEDMINASDEFLAKREQPEEAAPVAAQSGDLRFWVSHIPYKRTVRIHAADCSSCNHGRGKGRDVPTGTFWTGFATLDEAIVFGAEKEPDEHRICKLCLGEYNTLGRYGRSR